MKNILICCEFFYPSIGGVQKVVNELAKNFNLYGHNVTIVTSKHLKSLPFKERDNGVISLIPFEL